MAFCSRRAFRRLLHFIAYVAAGVFAMSQAGQSTAENFRIETKVFEGDKKEATSEVTTIFCDGVVYDFLKSPKQIAVFSKPSGKNAGRFILLNEENRIRTEFSTAQLQRAIENLREGAEQQGDEFLKFAANPKFEESFDPRSGRLILASHVETYTVDTEAVKNQQAAREYREFLDWYAQLNTLLSAGPPPQPRLELNKSLTRHKVIPKTVERTRDGSKAPIRAEHEFTWLLSQEDMARVDDVDAALASYRSVENGEYLYRTRSESEEK